MIWSRIWAGLLLVGLAALAVEPLVFIALAVPAAGVWLAQNRRLLWWPWFLAYAMLGLLSQALPVPAPNWPTPPAMGLPAAERNLIPPFALSDLRGWNPVAEREPLARPQGDGFWRVSRISPTTQAPYLEIFSARTYPLKANQTYVKSFYFRHNGSQIAFELSFVTARGQQVHPAEIHALGNQTYRAWAVYQAQEGDLWLRAPHLVNLEGDWTWLEIGFAQLSAGEQLSEYIPGGFLSVGMLERMGWWLGTGLIGMVILLASQHLYRLLGPQAVAAAVLLGLLASTLVGLQQHLGGVERVSGFSLNPNLYGVGVVVLAWLVVLLGGSHLRLGAGVLSAVVVFISASRAALLGWVALLLLLSVHSSRWLRGTALVGAGVLALVLGLQPDWLGRIGDSLRLDHPTNLSRLEIWQVAWQAFEQNPLAGLGIHNFGFYYQINLPEYAHDPYVLHTHSLPLKLLAETGLLGLLGFLLLWGYALLWLARHKAWLGLAMVGMVLGVNLVDYTFFTAQVYYAVWLALGWQVYRYSGEQR